MTIPGFQKMMFPLLKLSEAGQVQTTKEVIEELARQFELTPQDRQQLNSKTGQLKYNNRVNWALFYLKRTRLLESTERGKFQITARGIEVLTENPPIIDLKYLKKFAEYPYPVNSSTEDVLSDEDALQPPDDATVPETTVAGVTNLTVPETLVLYDPAALNQLIERFKIRYTDFNSAKYLKDERESKVKANEGLRELLTQPNLEQLISQQKFAEGKALLKQAYGGNNLLNQFDVPPIHNGPERELVIQLNKLYYDETTSFEARFNEWVQVLSREKPRCWPIATYYLMLHDPARHILVKPTPYRELLKLLKSSIVWQVKPDFAYYSRLQELARALLEELKPLGARDMIDVQSFIWTIQDEPELEDVDEEEKAELTTDEAGASSFPLNSDVACWRVHFPQADWDKAREKGVVGIDWPLDNTTNQSVQRFKQIKVGDRIIVYLKGGKIGGVGSVSRPYYDLRMSSEAREDFFGGRWPQQIGVVWNKALVSSVKLVEKLKTAEHNKLLNKLINPHTVVSLELADYKTVLLLLNIADQSLSGLVLEPEKYFTRLPSAWPKLTNYLDFVRKLEIGRAYSGLELREEAIKFDQGFNRELDPYELADALRQLRLLRSSPNSPESYQLQTYVEGADEVLRRLMALALLLPAQAALEEEISDKVEYELPVLKLGLFLQEKGKEQENGQARSLTSFAATGLGEDGLKLLDWYHEAGLVTLQGDDWKLTENALSRISVSDPASILYNKFLDTLEAELAGNNPQDLLPVDGSLPPAHDFAEKLVELGQALLIDERVVERIYRSLMAGRHIVLSGPPGTGKTELAKRLPTLLWREAPQTFGYLPTELDRPPVETRTRQRKGYYPVVVTATEDWGVRDLVGGIGPKLEGVGASSKGPLTYAIQYGVLTRVVLQNYAETKDGQALPPDLAQPQRQDYYNANERYRGSWLIIDEFTRAPVDAAFGSLLTTLSGSGKAYLTIPLAEGEIQLPLPRDFRIIGTLNSFDRHFLNQISEALKRRFDFIDVLPPSPKEAEYEQGVAIARALAQLWENRLSDLITFDQNEKSYSWEKVIRVELKKLTNTSSLKRYQLEYLDPLAKEALTSFWRLFSAIRVFRQLGTAQLEAVYTNLFTDVLLLGQSWSEALDTALADSLADQLQVLTRDEQRILIAYLDYADNANNSFVNAFAQILSKLPAGRQTGLLHALCEADRSQNEQGDSDIVTTSDKMPTTEQHGRVFELGQALNLPPAGKSVFRRRLRDLIGERGL